MAKRNECYELTPRGFFQHILMSSKGLDEMLVFMMHNGYNALIWNAKKRDWEWGTAMWFPKKGKKK